MKLEVGGGIQRNASTNNTDASALAQSPVHTPRMIRTHQRRFDDAGGPVAVFWRSLRPNGHGFRKYPTPPP